MRAEKVLDKMSKNKRDWDMRHFISVAEEFGVNHRSSGTSHYVFTHKMLSENGSIHITIPKHKDIHPSHVTRFIRFAEQVKADKSRTIH